MFTFCLLKIFLKTIIPNLIPHFITVDSKAPHNHCQVIDLIVSYRIFQEFSIKFINQIQVFTGNQNVSPCVFISQFSMLQT